MVKHNSGKNTFSATTKRLLKNRKIKQKPMVCKKYLENQKTEEEKNSATIFFSSKFFKIDSFVEL